MSYRRSGDYIVKVTPGEQFKQALGFTMAALIVLFLASVTSHLWLFLYVPLIVLFLYTAWMALVNGWKLLVAEGDAMYGRHD